MGIFDRFGKKPAPVDPPPAAAASDPAKKASLFDRFKAGLASTARVLNTDIRDLFKKEGRLIDEEFLDELFAIMVRTDMGAGPASEIKNSIATEFRGRVVHLKDVLEVVKVKLRELMDQPVTPLKMADSGPTVIMAIGVNGSGKTTSIAKLASLMRKEGKKVVLGAGDTFRAAAVQQLTIWGERTGAEVVKGEPNADPASVAHRAVSRAKEINADVCILDTAGRLQTQNHLMQELSKIVRVIGKVIPEAPHEKLLVIDATAGQNGISQAAGFSEAAGGCTGIVLTKLDGTAKGGVVIPIRKKFNLPVKFIGLGEKDEDLEVFRVEEFVEALFEDAEK